MLGKLHTTRHELGERIEEYNFFRGTRNSRCETK